jgi:4-hydroxy-4-methyl-2-oxoglutarate aldolase
MPADLLEAARGLTTAHLADACVRTGTPAQAAPPGIQPLFDSAHVIGQARPVQHTGSVDVFLEALDAAAPGQVLVVDNGGRQDEACLGDLVAVEAAHAGLAGILVWGQHRDTAELRRLGLPLWSYGALAFGPRRLDPRPADALECARFGDVTVTTETMVMADADGALFFPRARADTVFQTAAAIAVREQGQARRVRAGTSLRRQFQFEEYLARRRREPTFSFRAHLRDLDAAIEE